MGVDLAAHLEGPEPWYASGHASFKFFGLKVQFDLEVGGKAPGEPKPIAHPRTDALAALAQPLVVAGGRADRRPRRGDHVPHAGGRRLGHGLGPARPPAHGAPVGRAARAHAGDRRPGRARGRRGDPARHRRRHRRPAPRSGAGRGLVRARPVRGARPVREAVPRVVRADGRRRHVRPCPTRASPVGPTSSRRASTRATRRRLHRAGQESLANSVGSGVAAIALSRLGGAPAGAFKIASTDVHARAGDRRYSRPRSRSPPPASPAAA